MDLVDKLRQLRAEKYALQSDPIVRARFHLDRIYEVADKRTKGLLIELDLLLSDPTPRNAERASQLAEDIQDWCNGEQPLTGQALAAKIHEVFGMEAPKPAA